MYFDTDLVSECCWYTSKAPFEAESFNKLILMLLRRKVFRRIEVIASARGLHRCKWLEMVTGSENANHPWSGLAMTLTPCLWVHSAVGDLLLNRYKVNLTGKETSAVLQRQFCKLSGCGISGMFAQEETACTSTLLFLCLKAELSMPLACTDTHRGGVASRRERLKNRSAGHPRSLPCLSSFWQGEFNVQ